MSVNTAMNQKENLIFTFDPGLAPTLAKNNIKLVNLGNNHILNFGPEGLNQTKKYLTDAGVDYFGDPGAGEPIVFTKDLRDKKIVFVNYNYAAPRSWENSLAAIQAAEKDTNAFIVLYAHWGTEYQSGDPSSKTRSRARAFIDAGADLVIGTHPHVIQIKEQYEDESIYYSLGNFVFDQYFSPATQEGLAVQALIYPKDLRIGLKEFRVEIGKDGRTVIKH